MMQKGDPHTELFSTLSGVILLSCILSQLNILGNNLIKPYFTEVMIYPLFTVTTIFVLQRIGFDQSRVFHMSKHSVLYLE